MFTGKTSNTLVMLLTLSFSCAAHVFTVISVAVTTHAHIKRNRYAHFYQFVKGLVPGEILLGVFKYCGHCLW